MIKQLLSLATVATMAFSANAEIKTLWESSSAEGEQVNWSTQIPGTVFTAADCANYNGGDKIIVTVVKFDAALDAYPQIALKDGSWGDLAAGVVVKNMTMPNDVTFSLTPTQVATMKEKGWFISGVAAWITKVQLETSDIVVDPNAIWFGKEVYPDNEWWSVPALSLSAGSFADAKAGDQLVFVCSEKSGSFILQPFLGSWSGTKLNTSDNPEAFTIDGNNASITLTEDYVAELQKGGLVLQAGGCTLTSILLVPAGTTTGIEDIAIEDANAPVEYFNLQGIRVNNPENGIFIRRQGKNVTKVIVK